MNSKLENLQLVYDKLSEANDTVNEILDSLSLEEMVNNPLSETRQNLNILLEGFSKFLFETSHIDSFLNTHNTSKINTKSFESQSFLIKYQALSQEIKGTNRRILECKSQINQAFKDTGSPISSTTEGVFSKKH